MRASIQPPRGPYACHRGCEEAARSETEERISKALRSTFLVVLLLGLLGAIIGIIEGVVIGSFLGSGVWVILWAILLAIFNVIVLGRLGFLIGKRLARRKGGAIQ